MIVPFKVKILHNCNVKVVNRKTWLQTCNHEQMKLEHAIQKVSKLLHLFIGTCSRKTFHFRSVEFFCIAWTTCPFRLLLCSLHKFSSSIPVWMMKFGINFQYIREYWKLMPKSNLCIGCVFFRLEFNIE